MHGAAGHGSVLTPSIQSKVLTGVGRSLAACEEILTFYSRDRLGAWALCDLGSEPSETSESVARSPGAQSCTLGECAVC